MNRLLPWQARGKEMGCLPPNVSHSTPPKGIKTHFLASNPKVNIQIKITSFLAPRAKGILYSTTTLHSSCSWFGLAASSVNAMCLVLHVTLLVRCGPTAALQLRLLRCRHAQPGGFCWEEAYNNNSSYFMLLTFFQRRCVGLLLRGSEAIWQRCL